MPIPPGQPVVDCTIELREVEPRVWRMPKGLKFAVCLDGANACPPEDVGGSWGYGHYLAVLADPTHEEHDHLSGWRGPFDPKTFDIALVNAHLQVVR